MSSNRFFVILPLPMKLKSDEINHIAQLARLGLTNEEKERMATQLSAILDYLDQLKEVDTSDINPTAQVTGLENVMRDDEIERIDSETRKGLLDSAPETENDLVKSKAVFE